MTVVAEAEPIHLALLLPLSAARGYDPVAAGAAALAVDVVNADPTLLPGRALRFSWADSGWAY